MSSPSKIIDCFIFYNELDLLTYRLHILNSVVDYFIIVESTHTFTGKPKELVFDINKGLFDEFNHKIIHIIVEDMPYKYPTINYDKGEQWQNEYHQRNCIDRGIKKVEVENQDIIIISDLDEIPDPSTLLHIKSGSIPVTVNSLEQDLYYYNLNCKLVDKWYNTKVLSYQYYKQMSISCNTIRESTHSVIKKGGWHLSYFGNAEFIKNKIETFSHQELNNSNNTNVSNIHSRIVSCKDVYNRSYIRIDKIEIKDNTYLPYEYDKYLSKYILTYR